MLYFSRIVGGNPPSSGPAKAVTVGAAIFQAFREGEATMSLLPRRSIPATPVLILVAVTILSALPVSWSTRAPGSAIAPALVWAGGSPDETLAPHRNANAVTPTTPKTFASAAGWRGEIEISPNTTYPRQPDYRNAVSARYLWTVLWRVSATLALRL